LTLPTALLQSLQDVAGFDKPAFTAVHDSGEQVTSIRFNPAKTALSGREPQVSPPAPHDKVPWSSNGCYLATRPSFTFDPLFHAGVYYVQEASSMFVEQVLEQTADLSRPLRVLDLCAAPGGKSTLLQSLISKESLLVCNEVIKSRAAVLEENMVKWGAANVVVTNNDPAHFARLENYFDIIVIDAPCSGSGLLRRDPEAITEWSENNVALCSQRQQRIIADVWPALRQNGLLIYSTCSYSAEEDEMIMDWVYETFQVEGVRIKTAKEWNIVETFSAKQQMPGYRFYPDKVKGEGLFIAAARKKEGALFAGARPGKNKIEQLGKTEELLVRPWINEDEDIFLFKQKDAIMAFPAGIANELAVLQSALYLKRAGIITGKLAGKDLIPDHALAVSTIVNKNIPYFALNRQEAIQYLRRDEIKINTMYKGWMLVKYEGYNLGWIKALTNRFNNYYPKEWRIMKQPA